MATGRLHVSLLMIDREFEGPLPRVKVALVERVLADVEWPRTELHFDQVATLPGPRSRQPLVLLSTRPQPSLSHLFEKLVTVLADAGVAQRGEYTFLPHMTLLYDERVVEARPLEPLQWTATRFDLIHSHIGLSRYDHLASWPLPA